MSRILFKCEIPGRPGILKNSKRITRTVNGRTNVRPSAKYEEWANLAYLFIVKASRQTKYDFPMNLCCRFYFVNHQSEPDLSNAYQGIEDLLQKAGVIEDDKLIYSHDGSRKIFGAEFNRVEIVLTPFEESEEVKP